MSTLTEAPRKAASAAIPSTVHCGAIISREVVLPGVVEPAGFMLHNRTLDAPGAGLVLIQVEASGISFAEQSMRRGRYPGQPAFPFVPGYDLVGVVVLAGPDVDPSLIGKRVAALTKTGGWSTYALLSADILLPVPDGIDPAEAETLVVNGITAWQMLHRDARIQRGQTILVHGANGGVGTILVQLALHAGVRVIGTASPRHHDTLRAQGVEPVDYNDPNLAQRLRQLVPDGVDAAFDNVGGTSATISFGLLKRGGTLICLAIASAKNGTDSVVLKFIGLVAQVIWYNILPNGRRATFYNIWSGKGSKAFLSRMQEDFAQLMDLLARGVVVPKIAARFPLEQIRVAMELAESRTVYGKVILLPTHKK
ncbi:medium chain dehydrogenase/reductase family protein [Fibrivirga algicola]|uniref:Zinc-binding dehydrogenase n=1 Tax=Fibrivirga algicola TaxID=2950420 RepID=A0ABX0QEI3_9BACT|nr:medium chain dehydrogenase/reductase family protein [Fibrivirga algicola]NID09666.1 zinc-binding dehydrogenase [Fibrivirga algicola]